MAIRVVDFRSLVLLAILNALIFTLGCRDARPVSLIEAISQDLDVRIPADAKVIEFEETPPIDPAWIAKIELPIEHFESIQDQIESKLIDSASVSHWMHEKCSWWKINKPVFEKQFRAPSSVVLLIATEGRDENSVFLFVEHIVF